MTPERFDQLFPANVPTAPRGFAEWMAMVEAVIFRRCGLASADLDDYCYLDAFEDGATPAQAARAAIQNAGG